MSRKNAHIIMTVVCFVNILLGPTRILQGWFYPLSESGADLVGYLVLGVGGALFLVSFLSLRKAFLGDVEPVTDLVESGIYRFARHPVYLSFIIILLGYGIWTRSVPSLIFTVLLSVPSSCIELGVRRRLWERDSAVDGRIMLTLQGSLYHDSKTSSRT